MTNIRPVVLTVSMNEPAVRLSETVRRVPVNHRGGYHTEDHRIQEILLVRDNHLCEFTKDLGKADKYPGEGFVILSADERRPVGALSDLDTVGELVDAAEELRMVTPFATRVGIEPPDLANGFRKAIETAWKEQEHISVFGPLFSKQRA